MCSFLGGNCGKEGFDSNSPITLTTGTTFIASSITSISNAGTTPTSITSISVNGFTGTTLNPAASGPTAVVYTGSSLRIAGSSGSGGGPGSGAGGGGVGGAVLVEFVG